MHATFLSLVFVSLCGITNALRLPVSARSNVVSRDHDGIPHRRGFSMHRWRPQNFLQTSASDDDDDITIDNAKDIVYATNITLGGKEFPIQLDTGSSDVWVMPPFALDINNSTDEDITLTFGIGQASGHVAYADMQLGDYTVPNQAFLNVSNATSFGAIFNNGIFGIMGLSFDQGSDIFAHAIAKSNTSTSGRTFLSNVFAQNASAPNIFTVLLGRTDDPDGDQEGIFTVGEYDDQFKQVADQPKLPRTPAQLDGIKVLPRWSVQMDGMTVNGNAFQFNQSSVPEADPGKTVAVLDTGFTSSQLPTAAVDFIYQSIPGAVYNNQTKLYEIPCDATTDLSFVFGGQEFHIDPLDITVVKNSNNRTVCNNAFRAMDFPSGAGLDMILGVSFLKNAYVSFDFGDWTPDNRMGVPFVQMLPITDIKDATATFQATRAAQFARMQADIAALTGTATNVTSTASSTDAAPTPTGQVQTMLSSRQLRAREPRDVIQAGNPRVRVVVTAHRIPVPFPFLPQAVNNCAHAVLMTSGPAVLALLSGIAVLVFIGTVASVALVITHWTSGFSSDRDEEYYVPIQLKEDTD